MMKKKLYSMRMESTYRVMVACLSHTEILLHSLRLKGIIFSKKFFHRKFLHEFFLLYYA